MEMVRENLEESVHQTKEEAKYEPGKRCRALPPINRIQIEELHEEIIILLEFKTICLQWRGNS